MVAFLLCARLLPAQDAPYRPALAQLRAALDSEGTTIGIDRVAGHWDSTAAPTTRRVGNAYIQLRRGIVANDSRMLQSAWDGFDQVVQVHPDWPYAVMGLAISALEIEMRGYKVPGIYNGSPGLTHYEGAANQFTRLLVEEPNFEPAIDWIANSLLTDEGDRVQPAALMQALDNAIASNPAADPRLLLIVARSFRLEGNAPESVRRIDAYLRQGGDSGVGDFELARSLASMDSFARGARVYLAGAQFETAPTRAIYRLDLSWIATPLELATFDRLPADSIGTFVTRFWDQRDAREFRAPGSRLQEHLRRWAYVSAHFRIADPGAVSVMQKVIIPNPNEQCALGGTMTLEDYEFVHPSSPMDYRARERIFDHRAVVYMRHGEPLYQFGGDTALQATKATGRQSGGVMDKYDPQLTRAAATSMGLVEIPESRVTQPFKDRNITWVYMMEGQLRAFTFMGHVALGTAHPTTLIVYMPPNLDVLLRLAALSPSYAQLAGMTQSYGATGGGMIPLTCQPEYRDIVAEQQHGADVAVHSDSYLELFAHPIGASIQLAAVGQPALGTGELVAAIGLRIEDLQEVAGAGDASRAAYAVRVRIAAIDSVTGEVTTSDTVRRFVGPRAQTGWLPFIATLPILRGYKEVRVSLRQGDDRGSTLASTIQPAGAAFAASDLVLGSETGAASWRRDGGVVPMTPFSTYASGGAVLIYQELYGLKPGTKYRTMISLRKAGNPKTASAISFEDAASGSMMASSRRLTLDQVKPGTYDLVVEVQEQSTGRNVRRARTLTVTTR